MSDEHIDSLQAAVPSNKASNNCSINMADVQLQDSNHSSVTVKKLEKNNEIDCQHCEELKAEIQKAKQDISSYREIIKILLEEQTTTQQQQPGTDKLKREE